MCWNKRGCPVPRESQKPSFGGYAGNELFEWESGLSPEEGIVVKNKWLRGFGLLLLGAALFQTFAYCEYFANQEQRFVNVLNIPRSEDLKYELNFETELFSGGRRIVNGWIFSPSNDVLYFLNLSILEQLRPEEFHINIRSSEFIVGLVEIEKRVPGVNPNDVIYLIAVDSNKKIRAIASPAGAWAYLWGWY